MHFDRRFCGMLALIAVAGGALAGCSKNDNSGPTGPTGPTTTQYTQDTAEEVGVATAQAIEGLMGTVPGIASGDLVGGLGGFGGDRLAAGAHALVDSATFDTADTAWVYNDTLRTMTPSDTTDVTLGIAAKFRTGPTAHMDRSTWDNIGAALDIGSYIATKGDSATPAIETTSRYHFDLTITPDSTGTTDAPWHVTGGGHSTTTIALPGLGTSDTFPQSTYDFELDPVEQGSCPGGTITVTMGAYQLVATYTFMSDTVSWQLTHNGTLVKSGDYACGSGI